MPHYQIFRLEPRRGQTNSHEYPIGYIQADSSEDAIDDALAGMRIVLRDGERVFSVRMNCDQQIRQAKAVHRERDRSILDCMGVLERIKFSVD